MGNSRRSTYLRFTGACAICAYIVLIQYSDAAAKTPALDIWRAWLEEHPLPLKEQDGAEEAVLRELFPKHPFSEVRDALLEREVRREYLRIAPLIRNRRHWERVTPAAFRREAVVRKSDRDPVDFVLRTTRALLADLEQSVGAEQWTLLERELAGLEGRGASLDVAQEVERFALFREACALRRRIVLSNPLLDFPSILFTKRRLAAADHMCDQYFGNFARGGGGLFLLENPFGPSPHVRNLLEGSRVENGRLRGKILQGGAFLQPALSYDGKAVLFSYSECGLSGDRSAEGNRDPTWSVEMTERPPWRPETSYHVFRVNIDGTGLIQITDGPWNDLHPNWLPDGRVVFISERRGGFGRCHGRPVPLFTLHAMDSNGRNLMRLSHHEGNEWHPSVNGDGMILYSRWDYADRGHNQAHHPWITGPDGRDPRAIHGNFKPSHDLNPDMELNVVAIPGSHRYVATASAHHGQAYGSLIVIDPRIPDDDALGPVRRLTPDVGFPETSERGALAYGTAWPLSENYYLCVYSPDGGHHGIYMLDAFGNRELCYRDPEMGCRGPVPVNSRKAPPIVPSAGEPARLVENPTFHTVGDPHALEATSPGTTERAVVGLVNVYDSLYPFPPGVKIRELRIVHLLPKSTPLHHTPQIGYGSETSGRAVLGTVPVEEDGSAYFYLPPAISVYFQALDEQGLAVQSMRSSTYVHGGERLLCAGCHERKGRSPAPASVKMPRAFSREPSEIQSEAEGSNPISFPRLVQPLLERHCVKCHGEDAAEEPDLRRGNWREDPFHWYRSYRNLHPYAFHYGAPRRDQVKNQYDRWQPARTIPGKFGARASRLLPLLEKGHEGVELSPEEIRRITLWLDTNSDFFGAYENVAAQAGGERVDPKLR